MMNSESFPIRGILRLLAGFYGLLSGVRNALFDRGKIRSFRSALPVVSIGNLTAGGNGKTPLCIFLVRALAARGHKPVVLSRGYGANVRGPHLVTLSDNAGGVGDEPLLIAKSCGLPVVISRSRSKGARFIEQHGLGDVIVLDDGFQHRRLARDVDIVSIFVGTEESVSAFVAGELLPIGRFRENRDRGLRRASLVVASSRRVLKPGEDVPHVDKRIMALMPSGVTVFRAAFEFAGLWKLNGEGVPLPKEVVALAGIANPEGFFRSLEEMGVSILERFEFEDHHKFTERDFATIEAAHSDVLIVCTEKDAIKLRELGPAVVQRCAEVRVTLRVVPEDAFIVAVARSLPPVSLTV